MNAMLEGAPLQPSSSAHRWRQLQALDATGHRSGPDVLNIAAALLCAATDAAACEICFDAPTGPQRASFGRVPGDDAERAVMYPDTHAYQRLEAEQVSHAVPLSADGQTCGMVELYGIDELISARDLEAAAALIGAALSRCTEWSTASQQRTLRRPPMVARRGVSQRAQAKSQHERDSLLQHEIEVRKQVGRDLHDGPVQQVAVATLMVQYVRRVAELAPEGLAGALNDLEQQLKRANRDLRTVLYELRPLGIVEEGLAQALAQYVARLQEGSGPQIVYEGPSELPRLAPAYENGIFLIAQEALNNVRKHAHATHVIVRAAAHHNYITVDVRDNGKGFKLTDVEASYWQRGSYGLLNMRERAALFGGTCTITSLPGHGTVIQVRAPLPAETRSHETRPAVET